MHAHTILQSSSSPASGLALEDLKKTYPIGRMVFGKLPGYPWWAGYIASHQFCEGARGQVAKLWISWYGESDLSHVSRNNDTTEKWEHRIQFRLVEGVWSVIPSSISIVLMSTLVILLEQ